METSYPRHYGDFLPMVRCIWVMGELGTRTGKRRVVSHGSCVMEARHGCDDTCEKRHATIMKCDGIYTPIGVLSDALGG